MASDSKKKYRLRSGEATKAYAEENGLGCFVAHGDELFVDLDDQESIERFDRLWPIFKQHFMGAILRRSGSKSMGGVGEHVYIRLDKPYPPAARIALQAALGSDGTREILSIARVMAEDPEPVLFFEKGDPS